MILSKFKAIDRLNDSLHYWIVDEANEWERWKNQSDEWSSWWNEGTEQ